MTPSEIVDLYEATVGSVGYGNLFVIGSLCDRRERVAVSIQQTRAINLVHSLLDTGRLAGGARLGIVGAGAAGLTAAAYAIVHGVNVTVFESRDPLWNLRGCRTRWLHPNLFPKWPDDGWDLSATCLPVMNWHADYACNVGQLLWSKFTAYAPSVVEYVTGDLRLERSAGPGWSAHGTRRDGSPLGEDFDVVILAVGFGAEARLRDATASVYWLDDVIEREDPHRPTIRYLVSGTGDGGLTDLLRVRLRHFRHHHLRELLEDFRVTCGPILRELTAADDAAMAAMAAIDERERSASLTNEAAKAARGDVNRQVSAAFLRLASGSYAARRVLGMLRPTTTVLLTNREGVPLPLGSWRVSRFLAALLLVEDRDGTRYFASDRDRGANVHALVPGEGRAPQRFEVTTDRGREHVDAVVYRHGTESALESLLYQQEMAPDFLAQLRRKWQGRQTSTLLVTDFPDHDRERRTRAHAVVRGITPGCSVVGLLARLLQHVEPAEISIVEPTSPGADAAAHDPSTRGWPDHGLVIDEAALLVTPEADRIAPTLDGWHLAGKWTHANLVTAIRKADESLECLSDPANVERRRAQLEQHWVLPWPCWRPAAPPTALLRNTCVARHREGWRLRYVRREQGAPPQHVPNPSPGELSVEDFEAARLRVLVAPALTSQIARIALDFRADRIVGPHGYVDT